MSVFLIDEDLPRKLAAELQASELNAVDIRDLGLGGKPDSAIFEYAMQRNLTIVTADLDFASLLTYPLRSHFGIVEARLPHLLSAVSTNQRIVQALRSLSEEPLAGTIVIIEPDRVRLRRA